MTQAIADTRHMTMRHVMELLRQPWWIFVNLVQPIVWLLLFGALFGAVTDIPGFGSDNYIQFLAPGVITMSILFTSIFAGIEVIWDRQFGFLKETLVAPVPRILIMVGRTLGGATVAVHF